MAAISASDCTITQCEPGYALKRVLVETPATADTADTIALTLSAYGISDMMGIRGVVETTANSVFVEEAPTTAISSGVLTITIGGSAVSNKKRNYIIEGK